jgi:glycosyltransferase involved in cell wall biosynthesis
VKILFVSSGNRSQGKPSILIENQANSLKSYGEIDIYLIDSPGFIGYFSNIFKLAKKINSVKPDVIHAHYSLCGYVAYFAKILSFYKPKLVVSLMGSDVHRKSMSRYFLRFFIKINWKSTIVKTQQMKAAIELNEIHVIPNGVDLSTVNHALEIEKDTLIFPADPIRESKNFDLAQAAFEEVKKHNPDVKMNIVYGVTHSDLLREIASSSVLIVTSLWEGSPNVVKEAMALNRPVVSTDVGDVSLLFGPTDGYFISSNQVDDFAQNILKALDFVNNNSETRGRERIISLKLDSESAAKKLMEVYVS